MISQREENNFPSIYLGLILFQADFTTLIARISSREFGPTRHVIDGWTAIGLIDIMLGPEFGR